MNTPKVSVCLLTWNRATVIARSIKSLLNQSFGDFELIINDDNSTDATESVCAEFVAKDPRVRYFKNPTNLKYSGNSNAAVSRASGQYLMFAHDGDVYHPDLLSKWTDGLNQNPNAAIAFSALNVMDNQGVVVKTFVEDLPNLVDGRSLLRDMLKRFDCPIFGITMVRKAHLNKVGVFDPRFPRITDVDMWMRLLSKFDAVYVREPLIDVMPREDGHENVATNWSISRQLVEIRELNIRRVFADSPAELQAYMRLCQRDKRHFYMQNILWCLKRLKFKSAMEGFSNCPSSVTATLPMLFGRLTRR